MRRKMEIPERERKAGEGVLLVGIGALLMLLIIAVLSHQGYVHIPLTR